MIHCIFRLTSRLAVLLLFVSPLSVALDLVVTDSEGEALPNAVVWVNDVSVDGKATNTPYVLDQVDREFVPHVLAVPKGARIEFPNSDTILHHVYSFSEAKTFQIKLYKERTQAPLVFEQTGVVEVGCNIHDWMLAYILVVDSALFGKTDRDGQVTLDVPAGSRALSVWHPRFETLKQPEVRRLEPMGQDQLVWAVQSPLNPPMNAFEVDRFDGY